MPHLSHTHYERITLRHLPSNMEQTTPQTRQTTLQRRIQTQSQTHPRHSNRLLDMWQRQTTQRPIHSRPPHTSRPTKPTSSSPQIMQQPKRKQTHPTPIETPPHATQSPHSHQKPKPLPTPPPYRFFVIPFL